MVDDDEEDDTNFAPCFQDVGKIQKETLAEPKVQVDTEVPDNWYLGLFRKNGELTSFVRSRNSL